MSPRHLKFILSLYPSRWRERHGDELAQLVIDLANEPDASLPRLVGNLLLGAAAQRLRPSATAATAVAAIIVGGVTVGSEVGRHPVPHRPTTALRLIMRRDRTGHITAVAGVPVKLILDPKTNRIISVRRRYEH